MTILITFLVACGDANKSKKSIYINELLSANANTNYDPDFKEFSDWIELYNDTNETIDIGGYYLSDDEENLTKWQIPQDASIAPYGYIMIWADDRDTNLKALHTNFKLSQKGETLTLTNQDKEIIDQLTYGKQESDITCMKEKNNIVHMSPTPNAKNTQIHTQLIRNSPPSFSLESGFYEGSQIIELYQENQASIYYTTDGSTPYDFFNTLYIPYHDR